MIFHQIPFGKHPTVMLVFYFYMYFYMSKKSCDVIHVKKKKIHFVYSIHYDTFIFFSLFCTGKCNFCITWCSFFFLFHYTLQMVLKINTFLKNYFKLFMFYFYFFQLNLYVFLQCIVLFVWFSTMLKLPLNTSYTPISPLFSFLCLLQQSFSSQ